MPRLRHAWCAAQAHLAGVVVREVQLCVLGGDSGQQEGPPLLADAVVVVGPVGWRGLCTHSQSDLTCFDCSDKG